MWVHTVLYVLYVNYSYTIIQCFSYVVCTESRRRCQGFSWSRGGMYMCRTQLVYMWAAKAANEGKYGDSDCESDFFSLPLKILVDALMADIHLTGLLYCEGNEQPWSQCGQRGHCCLTKGRRLLTLVMWRWLGFVQAATSATSFRNCWNWGLLSFISCIIYIHSPTKRRLSTIHVTWCDVGFLSPRNMI